MNQSLVFRPEAAEDLRQAYRWYEEQRAGLGEDLFFMRRDRACNHSGKAAPVPFCPQRSAARCWCVVFHTPSFTYGTVPLSLLLRFFIVIAT